MSAPPLHLVNIADPQGPRWKSFSLELDRFCSQRPGQLSTRLVCWDDVLRDGLQLDGLHDTDQTLIRIESPGRNRDLVKKFIKFAVPLDGDSSQVVSLQDDDDYGRLLYPRLAFVGFQETLHGIAREFGRDSRFVPLANPRHIAEMFDKNEVGRRLEANDIPSPPTIVAEGDSYMLLDQLRQQPPSTWYVKLAFGSSAAGIAVVRFTNGEASATTSMVKIDDHFYNTRQLRTVTGDMLHETLDFILREGACVQLGVPMAQIDGQNFDVRVVVIYGRPAFTIFRLSSNPMTNLHLGGRRGSLESCRSQIPQRAWLDALDHCVEAAQLYDSAVVGVDLVFERGYMRHYILELNAFGDFFPGWTNEQGKSVHQYLIEATARRFGLT